MPKHRSGQIGIWLATGISIGSMILGAFYGTFTKIGALTTDVAVLKEQYATIIESQKEMRMDIKTILSAVDKKSSYIASSTLAR